MKRLHIHIGVEKLDESIRFYSALFGAAPIKTKPDYAKWLLDDPRVNFAISTRAQNKGVDHLGIQVDDDAELTEMRERLKGGDMAVADEGETVCCYARSEKSWIQDPSGIPGKPTGRWKMPKFFSDGPILLKSLLHPRNHGQT